MPRIFRHLLLAALLLSPIAASAQIPGFTLEQAHILRWFTLPLQHTQASDIVQEMHWSGPPSDSLFTLPEGVEHIFAETKSNTLLVRATPDGDTETRNIVKVLDKAGYAFAPTLAFLPAPKGDTHIHWTDASTQGLEVRVLPGGEETFRAIIKSGAPAKTVNLDRFLLYNPIDLIVDTPRLRGDGSLMLDFSYGCWNGPPVEVSGIRRGDVLVVRGRQLSCATLIQVNY